MATALILSLVIFIFVAIPTWVYSPRHSRLEKVAQFLMWIIFLVWMTIFFLWIVWEVNQ